MNGLISKHKCLLVGSNGMSKDRFDAVNAAAHRAFVDVDFIQTSAPNELGWPMSPNALFRSAATYIAERNLGHWFWCEPDCVPLKPEWLDALDADYQGSRKPFMGVKFIHPYPHLTGTAVYPSHVRRYSPKMVSAHTRPFDLIDAITVMRNAHFTGLIEHRWGDIQNNIAPTFPDAESLKNLPALAVVFHRCKDGSLIKRLRERSGRRHYDEAGRLNNCILQLGRYGDIMNILPVAKHIKDNYAPPHFMASKAFAPMLDGVSYVKPVVFDGDYSRVDLALVEARDRFEHVIVSQVWGEGVAVPRECPSYNQESWRMAGFLDRWSAPKMKLVFDRRDSKREAKLIRQNVNRNAKPIMLLKLSGGESGPFEDHLAFQFDVTNRWKAKYQIIDLSQIKATRIYDLLALYDMADVLVTIDSATLHLANACDIPVLALLNDKTEWNKTLPRCNVLGAFPYSQAMRRTEEIHALIKSV